MDNFISNKIHSIIDGWYEFYYHFIDWNNLLKNEYDQYSTWEFFSYLNNEIKDPFVMYVSIEDYDALIDSINSPPEVCESIKRIFERNSPWEDSEDEII
jgi:hypothetical protein